MTWEWLVPFVAFFFIATLVFLVDAVLSGWMGVLILLLTSFPSRPFYPPVPAGGGDVRRITSPASASVWHGILK